MNANRKRNEEFYFQMIQEISEELNLSNKTKQKNLKKKTKIMKKLQQITDSTVCAHICYDI